MVKCDFSNGYTDLKNRNFGRHLTKAAGADSCRERTAGQLHNRTKHSGTGIGDAHFIHGREMGNRWKQSGAREDNHAGDT